MNNQKNTSARIRFGSGRAVRAWAGAGAGAYSSSISEMSLSDGPRADCSSVSVILSTGGLSLLLRVNIVDGGGFPEGVLWKLVGSA